MKIILFVIGIRLLAIFYMYDIVLFCHRQLLSTYMRCLSIKLSEIGIFTSKFKN